MQSHYRRFFNKNGVFAVMGVRKWIPGAISIGGRGGRRSGSGGGRVPAVERNPERLVREHLQVGGEAVGALDVGHLQMSTSVTAVGHPSIHPIEKVASRYLDAVLDGDAGEGVEPADAVQEVTAAGRHGRRRGRLVEQDLLAGSGAAGAAAAVVVLVVVVVVEAAADEDLLDAHGGGAPGPGPLPPAIFVLSSRRWRCVGARPRPWRANKQQREERRSGATLPTSSSFSSLPRSHLPTLLPGRVAPRQSRNLCGWSVYLREQRCWNGTARNIARHHQWRSKSKLEWDTLDL